MRGSAVRGAVPRSISQALLVVPMSFEGFHRDTGVFVARQIRSRVVRVFCGAWLVPFGL